MKNAWWIIVAVALGSLCACGGGGGQADAGPGGSDVHHTYLDGSAADDAGVHDGGPDAAVPDAGPDDGGQDARVGSDAGADTGADAGADSGIDAGVEDGGTDAGGDGGGVGPAPGIASITPDHGVTAGGTAVVIAGTNFRSGLSVTFDQAAATGIVTAGGGQVTCRTPPHAKGAVDVIVKNADGTLASRAGGYTFVEVAPPVITGVSPSGGPTAGGSQVTITGTGFAQGVKVFFGLAEGAVTQTVATEIMCGAPAHGKGAVDITVTNTDGQSNVAVGAFTYTEPGPRVDWCNIQYPQSLTTKVNVPTENIYGQVLEAGMTDSPGQGAGILAQLGYGDPGDDPSANPSTFQWTGAAYNVDVGNNDEYMAKFTVAVEGTYAYAYRFSLDGGMSWVYCDLDGTDNGFNRLDMGTLTVEKAGFPAPAIASVSPAAGPIGGGTPVTVIGQNFLAGAGVTFGGVDATGLTVDGMAMITCTTPPHAAGAVDLAVRNPDGQSGTLAQGFMYEAPAQLPDWGKLQWPPRMVIAPAAPPGTIYGRVYEPGITDAGGDAGKIKAQAGYGPPGSDPVAEGWQWANAVRNASCTDCGNNYEYAGTFSEPPDGLYDYTFRFSLDGARWLIADLDGSGNGYAADQAGKLAAGDVPEWCNLHWPPEGTISAGAWFGVYGRVYKAGITGQSGTHNDIEMGVGYATSATVPSGVGWTWWSGQINMGCGNCGNNDEFSTQIKIDAAGAYRYVVKFRYKSGPWIFCDADGSDNGLQIGKMGTLTVQ